MMDMRWRYPAERLLPLAQEMAPSISGLTALFSTWISASLSFVLVVLEGSFEEQLADSLET
jgi:hypothetical protein